MKGAKLVLIFLVFLVLVGSVFALSSSSSSSGVGGSYSSIAKDRPLKKIFFGDPVEYVKFELNEKVNSGMPFFKKVWELPEEVNQILGYEVYDYFEIESLIPDESLNFAEIGFEVENSWEGDVNLLRYKDGVWSDEMINVSFVKEKEGKNHYVASVPGFSYFVIASKIELEIVEQTVEGNVSVEVVNEIEEDKEFNVIFWFVLLIILVIFLIIFKFRHKK
jgi:PGF-pre-PGF domain-containing protein